MCCHDLEQEIPKPLKLIQSPTASYLSDLLDVDDLLFPSLLMFSK